MGHRAWNPVICWQQRRPIESVGIWWIISSVRPTTYLHTIGFQPMRVYSANSLPQQCLVHWPKYYRWIQHFIYLCITCVGSHMFTSVDILHTLVLGHALKRPGFYYLAYTQSANQAGAHAKCPHSSNFKRPGNIIQLLIGWHPPYLTQSPWIPRIITDAHSHSFTLASTLSKWQ